MPDGDVIPRTPVRLWKRPHTLLCTGADADVVADGVMHSLIASLRNKGGLPGARDLASTVQEFVAGKVGVADALAQLREVEWQQGGHVHTRVAADAAAKLLVELSQGMPLDATPLRAIVDRFCYGLIEYQLLGRFGPDQFGVTYSDYDGYLHWQQQVLAPLRPQVDALASEFERYPTGRGLKLTPSLPAPPRPGTAAILGDDLLRVIGGVEDDQP